MTPKPTAAALVLACCTAASCGAPVADVTAPAGATRLAEPPRAPIYAAEWYLPLEDGQRLLVREYGRGEPVVVLHGGWGAEHEYLLDLVWPHLASRRFVLYDQRGSLRSPARLESISVARHVADLELLREELGLERMTLLAHSMGTFLAMAYLEAFPERVGRMVLAGAIPPRLDGLHELANAETLLSRPEVQAVLEAEGLTGEDLDARRRTDAWRVEFASVNLFRVDRWRRLRGGQVFYAGEAGERAAASMPDGWDLTEVLRAHSWPITVVLGDHDFVDLGAERWTAFAASCPRLELRLLDRAGHAAWIDRPRAFAEAVADGLGIE